MIPTKLLYRSMPRRMSRRANCAKNLEISKRSLDIFARKDYNPSVFLVYRSDGERGSRMSEANASRRSIQSSAETPIRMLGIGGSMRANSESLMALKATLDLADRAGAQTV